MKRTKWSLAIVILAITVGCTTQSIPIEPPPATTEVLQVYTTTDTSNVATLITQNYFNIANIRLSTRVRNHQILLNQLNNHEIDYFISHHAPSDSQAYWSAPLLQDGIAIITHKENIIDNISNTQLRRIYRGFITNWAELGGDDADIIVYSREDGAGIRLEFDRMVMGQQQTTPNAQILSSTVSIIEQVKNEPNAIAYIPMSLITTGINVLSIDTVVPSINTISDNSYPLRLNIYVIGLQAPTNSSQELFSWIQNLGEDALQAQYAPLPR